MAKAKVLKRFIEPIITRSKNDTTHNRRISFSYLRQKEAVTELFSVVSDKVADRPGGYTRIIKLGNRLGDAAEMCFIELVDFNETYNMDTVKKKRTRRSKKSDTKKLDDTIVESATDLDSNSVVSNEKEVSDEKEVDSVVSNEKEVSDIKETDSIGSSEEEQSVDNDNTDTDKKE